MELQRITDYKWRIPKHGAMRVDGIVYASKKMLDAIREFFFATGVRIGMKPAGGIRTAKQALQYLVMVNETLGDDWLTPDLFRLGASTLANDILLQIAKSVDGRYQSGDYFSLP